MWGGVKQMLTLSDMRFFGRCPFLFTSFRVRASANPSEPTRNEGLRMTGNSCF